MKPFKLRLKIGENMCDKLKELSGIYFDASENVRCMGMQNVANLTFDERKVSAFKYDYAKYSMNKAKRNLDDYINNVNVDKIEN